jgi:hypothetical protein
MLGASTPNAPAREANDTRENDYERFPELSP